MNNSSPHPSPSPSLHESESTTLQRLISHFVAAKRSLSATSHVYRVNDIVDSARELIEETAILSAKNAFLLRGVNEEANALGAVREALDGVFKEGNGEFKLQVKSLDEAHIRLKATLQLLQDTVVDSSLGSKQPLPYDQDQHSPSASTQAPSRTLHDFISEDGHYTLIQSLHQDIDSYNDARNIFSDSQVALDQSLASLAKALRQVDGAFKRHRNSLLPADEAETPAAIPDLFHALTSHATETASLLQSLISHYDVCSTALKHTEGGGEAARAAAESATGQGIEAMDQSLYDGNKARQPITLDERAEMLNMVENDAQEVDDVVFEIRERLSEMEGNLAQILQHAESARTCHSHLAKVLQLLHRIGRELPSHIASLKTYSASWSRIKEDLKHKLSEIEGLDAIYEGFLRSYALLLKEVSRRAAAEAKMKKVLEKARREVYAMCDNELETRKDFLREVSDFLPRDIWPALVEAPPRWDFTAVAQDNLGEALPIEQADVGETSYNDEVARA